VELLAVDESLSANNWRARGYWDYDYDAGKVDIAVKHTFFKRLFGMENNTFGYSVVMSSDAIMLAVEAPCLIWTGSTGYVKM